MLTKQRDDYLKNVVYSYTLTTITEITKIMEIQITIHLQKYLLVSLKLI